MSTIPENQLTQDDFNQWAKVTEQLGKLKATEMLLRMKIFRVMFPNPVEGTNSVNLTDGWVLKAKYPINRKVLEDILVARTKEFKEAGLKLNNLIVRNPELAVAEYRKLTAEELKLFDQALEIKPGSPALEIVLPKRAKAQDAATDTE